MACHQCHNAERALSTHVRLYNGSEVPIDIGRDDIRLIRGYIENPVGPHVPAEGMKEFELLPGQAADVRTVGLWAGEPYATMGIGEYRFAIQ